MWYIIYIYPIRRRGDGGRYREWFMVTRACVSSSSSITRIGVWIRVDRQCAGTIRRLIKVHACQCVVLTLYAYTDIVRTSRIRFHSFCTDSVSPGAPAASCIRRYTGARTYSRCQRHVVTIRGIARDIWKNSKKKKNK